MEGKKLCYNKATPEDVRKLKRAQEALRYGRLQGQLQVHPSSGPGRRIFPLVYIKSADLQVEDEKATYEDVPAAHCPPSLKRLTCESRLAPTGGAFIANFLDRFPDVQLEFLAPPQGILTLLQPRTHQTTMLNVNVIEALTAQVGGELLTNLDSLDALKAQSKALVAAFNVIAVIPTWG